MLPLDSSTFPASAALAADDPVEIGPYQVLRLLGEGGMGKVYLARSAGSRLVALKVIRSEYAADAGFRARFRREVDAAAKVSGFFTTPVIDADADGRQPWLATSYVPAPSLGEVVRALGSMTEPALRALGAGLAEALRAIHSAGLIHRDLKPGNVLVAGDGPRVIDFGISRALDGTQLTRTGGILGTPGYMSPEQIVSGHEVGPPSDVFALGCVVVFSATGRNPYGAGQAADVLYRVVYDQPRLDGVPGTLRPLIEACLDKDPARRPAVTAVLDSFTPANLNALLTPHLMAELARRAQEVAEIAARPPSRRVRQNFRMPARSRRRFLGIAAAGVASVATAGGVTIALLRSGGSNPTASPVTVATPDVLADPEPVWTQSLPATFDYGGLDLAGTTIIRWDKKTAVGFDAASGSPRWTAKPTLGDDVSSISWLGVYQSTLFGTATDYASDNNLLFGIDANGQQSFSYAAGPTDSASGEFRTFDQLFDVVGGVALITMGGYRSSSIVATDVSSGNRLWTRDLKASTFNTAVADGHRCYLQDGTTTYGLDLRTGAQLWATQNTSVDGTGPSLALAADVVVISSIRLVALDIATGAQRWTAVNESTNLSKVAVSGEQVIVVDGQDTVWGLNARDGAQRWSTQSPLSLAAGGGTVERGPSASPTLITIPTLSPYGVIALRSATGKVVWAHQDTTADTEDWTVLATPDTVYAASPTSVYAFKDQP
jgi:predicted Ser/Thr protein kinase